MIAVVAAILMLTADAVALIREHRHPQPPAHPPAQSWDQENLKRYDVPDCRTGNPVFVAPGGNLKQC